MGKPRDNRRKKKRKIVARLWAYIYVVVAISAVMTITYQFKNERILSLNRHNMKLQQKIEELSALKKQYYSRLDKFNSYQYVKDYAEKNLAMVVAKDNIDYFVVIDEYGFVEEKEVNSYSPNVAMNKMRKDE